MPSGSGADNDPSNPLTATDVENAVETIDAPMSLIEKIAVPIVFTIFVVFRAADRVFMKALQNRLHETSYNLIFTSFIWPAAMQAITFCMVFGYIGIQRYQGNRGYSCGFFKLNQPLASSTGPIPTYMLALFSLGDQLNAAMSAPCGAFVSQPIQSVMTNFVLIWMAIVAFFWISVRFKLCHYLGMALVMVSVFIQFLPYIIDNECSPASYNGTTIDGMTNSSDCFSAYGDAFGNNVIMGSGAMMFFYIMFALSTIPAAVSNVYKQKVLQGVDADIFYVTWWSGWFQLLWGWISFPLLWIPLPGQDTITPGQTLGTIADTFRCMTGDTIGGAVPSCGGNPSPIVYVLLYFSFNATFNLCITWLIKRISATWVQVATVLCLNLCNIFSTQRWIMGDSAAPMSAYDWGGAIVVSFALVVYNLQPEVTADGQEILTQAGGSFVVDGHAGNVEKLSGMTPTGSFVKPGSFVGRSASGGGPKA